MHSIFVYVAKVSCKLWSIYLTKYCGLKILNSYHYLNFSWRSTSKLSIGFSRDLYFVWIGALLIPWFIVYISVCQWKFSLRAPPLRVNEWRIMYADNGDLFQEIFEYPITWCHRPPVFVSGNKIYIIFLLNFLLKICKKEDSQP